MNFMMQMVRQGFPCLFHRLTGFYCPGCGGTRAVRYLLRGEIVKSIQYHPLVMYMALVFVWEVCGLVLAKGLKCPKLHLNKYNWYVFGGILVILVNWIFKNYMLVARGIDLLP